jgi:hypothetical protein
MAGDQSITLTATLGDLVKMNPDRLADQRCATRSMDVAWLRHFPSGNFQRSIRTIRSFVMAREISPVSREKHLSAVKKSSRDVEDLFEISGLGTMWSRRPAAEFLRSAGELAGELGTSPLACVFIINERV